MTISMHTYQPLFHEVLPTETRLEIYNLFIVFRRSFLSVGETSASPQHTTLKGKGSP